uniref:Uncharacterized protein n=1 Tax=Rhizophora mucronata TaxID=61149 RepID=A0A2P2QHL2_RHIMU
MCVRGLCKCIFSTIISLLICIFEIPVQFCCLFLFFLFGLIGANWDSNTKPSALEATRLQYHRSKTH